MLEILLPNCVSIVSMCLFVCDLRSARARLPVLCGGATSVVSVTPLLASGVLACVSFVSLGSYDGVCLHCLGSQWGYSVRTRGRDM